MKFQHAIVKTPGRSLASGITSAGLGLPDYEKALMQHAAYVTALRACGLSVRILDSDEKYPDSTFVEDTALVTSDFAIITRPGATSRRGEVDAIDAALQGNFDEIEHVTSPGIVDAGDIMMVGEHFYIGLSSRTNEIGASQVSEFLRSRDRTSSTIPLSNVLHLKSAVAYIENNNLLATSAFAEQPEFARFDVTEIPDDERYAANCLWINGAVLVAAGFPKTKTAIQAAGYKTIELDMSEFQKLDGGLSCLSLRY